MPISLADILEELVKHYSEKRAKWLSTRTSLVFDPFRRTLTIASGSGALWRLVPKISILPLMKTRLHRLSVMLITISIQNLTRFSMVSATEKSKIWFIWKHDQIKTTGFDSSNAILITSPLDHDFFCFDTSNSSHQDNVYSYFVDFLDVLPSLYSK